MIPYCRHEHVMCGHLQSETCPRLWTDHPPKYPECQNLGERIKNGEKKERPLTSIRCPKCLRINILREQDENGEFTLGSCQSCTWKGKLLNTVKI